LQTEQPIEYRPDAHRSSLASASSQPPKYQGAPVRASLISFLFLPAPRRIASCHPYEAEENQKNWHVARNLSTSTLKDDAYAFIFGQQGLMAGMSLEGTKILRIKR
jgi:hypothetical protein